MPENSLIYGLAVAGLITVGACLNKYYCYSLTKMCIASGVNIESSAGLFGMKNVITWPEGSQGLKGGNPLTSSNPLVTPGPPTGMAGLNPGIPSPYEPYLCDVVSFFVAILMMILVLVLIYRWGAKKGKLRFWVWDARLTSVFISFLIYLGALRFQKLSVEPAPISIRAGPIDIPIIKFPVNWWNTSHQPGSISRSGTSIHVSMLIPIC
uniref:Cytochrome c biogenesis C n=1 Tax=Mirabilis himalaica TaxID=482968 RepID=A0A6M9TU82_9CARY|nr:cytochrome c biogenesis C [Mirabilis himalaica]QKN19362.1 cytochrome c biogenesis C [Mirabilis himalaica]